MYSVAYPKYEYVKFRCREIPKHRRLSLVQVRNVYSLLDFKSFDTRRERHTIFTMLTVPTSPKVNSLGGLARPRFKSQLTDQTNAHPVAPSGLASPRVKSQLTDPTNAHPVAPSWTDRPRVKTQLTSFSKSLNPHFRAFTPQFISYLGFLL